MNAKTVDVITDSEQDITVEVAYATPNKQSLIELMVKANCTVASAIEESGILSLHPEIDIKTSKVGVWNKVVRPSTLLRKGDRVEIYRPLIADPKEVRRRRAEKAVEEGRADRVTGGRPNRSRT